MKDINNLFQDINANYFNKLLIIQDHHLKLWLKYCLNLLLNVQILIANLVTFLDVKIVFRDIFYHKKMTQQLKYVRYAINYVKHVSIQQIIVFNVNILC